MDLDREPPSDRAPYPVIHARLWPFDEETVYDAPEAAGVYALWRYGVVIFYGHAQGGQSSIRTALAEHFTGLRGHQTRAASHCSWEIHAYPAKRLNELLSGFWATYHSLPSCNDPR